MGMLQEELHISRAELLSEFPNVILPAFGPGEVKEKAVLIGPYNPCPCPPLLFTYYFEALWTPKRSKIYLLELP